MIDSIPPSRFTVLYSPSISDAFFVSIRQQGVELVPHFISRVAMREHNPWISGAVTLSVLAGSFVLRYAVVYAGQMAKVVTA
jgi:hypothetical protein